MPSDVPVGARGGAVVANCRLAPILHRRHRRHRQSQERVTVVPKRTLRVACYTPGIGTLKLAICTYPSSSKMLGCECGRVLYFYPAPSGKCLLVFLVAHSIHPLDGVREIHFAAGSRGRGQYIRIRSIHLHSSAFTVARFLTGSMWMAPMGQMGTQFPHATHLLSLICILSPPS